MSESDRPREPQSLLDERDRLRREPKGLVDERERPPREPKGEARFVRLDRGVPRR
jgi:hypothetical protein